jgi:hypothetical protein
MNNRDKGLKFALAGMLVLAILASACWAGGKDQDPPKFYVRETRVDIGNAFEGEDITYTFKVRNTGVAELHILNVRPG